MTDWIKDNALTLLAFLASAFGTFTVFYRKYVLLDARITTLEARTIAFETEIKEELREIKGDIKQLLSRGTNKDAE